METFNWLIQNWFDVIQTLGILGGLLFTARIMGKDHKARTVGNMLAIAEQYNRIWDKIYENPELGRILERNVNLEQHPMTDREARLVKTLLLHLDVVRRTMEAGDFVEIQGLQRDVRDFFAHPIPKTVWHKIRPFQDDGFVAFIDESLRTS